MSRYIRSFKVGGIHFLRLHRLQLSFCICRASAVSKPSRSGRSEHAMCSHEFMPRVDPLEEALKAFAVTMCIAAFLVHVL